MRTKPLSASQLVELHLRGSVETVFSAREITKFKKRNASKIHPLSVRARTLGGAIQSANIRYGNQLQVLITALMNQSRKVSVHPLSGCKVQLPVNDAATSAIERYVNDRDRAPGDFIEDYRKLQTRLKAVRTGSKKKRRDVDLLLKQKGGSLILVELKFNDDHDTGKRPDIYRKVLLTADGLRRELRKPVTPMVCYFNSDALPGVRYLPDSQVVNGEKLLKKFAEIEFNEVAIAIRSLGSHFDKKIRSLARGI